jgi:hypothetical protein
MAVSLPSGLSRFNNSPNWEPCIHLSEAYTERFARIQQHVGRRALASIPNFPATDISGSPTSNRIDLTLCDDLCQFLARMMLTAQYIHHHPANGKDPLSSGRTIMFASPRGMRRAVKRRLAPRGPSQHLLWTTLPSPAGDPSKFQNSQSPFNQRPPPPVLHHC